MADIRFGTATRDITPSWPVMLHGYGARDRLSGIRAEDAVAEPISARALALEGGDGHGGRKRILIVCLDTVGAQAGEARMLRGKIARATGLAASDVMIAATHTHFAPSISTGLFSPPALGIVEPDPRYVAMVSSAVVEAASQAFVDLAEGVLEDYRVQVPSVLFNRRTITHASGAAKRVETNFLFPENPDLYEFSPVDAELAALRIRTARGPGVALLNFGCHPVTGGEGADRGLYRISADYPYYARTCVEEAWRCPALFTLGAAGDAVPMNRGGRSRQQIGAALGNAALLGERQLSASGRREEGAAVVASRTMEMEVKTIFPAASSDAERAYADSREQLIALGGRDPADPALQDAVRLFRENGIRAFRARLYPADRAVLEMHLLRIGRTVLVGLPFEVLSDISLRLKRAFPETVLVSPANGYEGYLPLAFEYERGGYEASAESTHFEIGTADRLLDRLLEELRTF